MSGGALNLANASAGGVTVEALTPLVALTLTNTSGLSGGQTSVSNINTTNGSINIIDASASDTINLSGYLIASNGSILLQNKGTSPSSAIDVSGAIIYASGTAPGVGQVSIVIGDVPVAANLVAGITPAGIGGAQTVGGNVYLGSTGNTGGTFTQSGTTTLNALGRNIVINEGTSGGVISFSGSNSVTADPPVGAVQVSASSIYAAVDSAITSSIVSHTNVVSSSLSLPQSNPIEAANNSANLTAGITNAKIESCIDHATSSTRSLTTVVDKSPVDSIRTLERGVTLLSPESDKVVQTSFGSVSVAAHAVVMIMSFDGGVAVYNLHDDKRGAVAINTAGQTIKVGPGRSAVLTNRNIRCFEEINPAQTVAYRSLTALELLDGTKAFQSEFNIVSLLQAIGPLRQFVSTSAPANQKATKSMLKTAAILMQYGGARPYQPMTAPQLTANATR